jgi:hypothetical protein
MKENLIGVTFGHWTVIKIINNRILLCECDCKDKTIKEVYKFNLQSGKSTSCGCYNKEIISNLKSKYNTYDLTGEYGIGYTSKEEPFYFDLEDYDKIKNYCWRKDKYKYIVTNEKEDDRKIIKMHRLIMNVYDEDIKIDHIFHNRYDNRKKFLRIASNIENSQNRSLQSNNTSGYTGVWYDKKRNKWVAEIKVNKKKKHIGRFNNLQDAVIARKNAEIKYFGDFRYKDNKEI